MLYFNLFWEIFLLCVGSKSICVVMNYTVRDAKEILLKRHNRKYVRPRHWTPKKYDKKIRIITFFILLKRF